LAFRFAPGQQLKRAVGAACGVANAHKESTMNVFDEFKRLVLELEKQKVKYALVGGVAMAFYTEPRFTQDIDFLVESQDFEIAN
jgi:hypothetical protein